MPTTHQPIIPSAEFVWFHEEQKFNQWWLWLIIYVTAGLIWYSFIQQVVLGQPIGSMPTPNWFLGLFWLLFGWGMPLLFHLLKLIIEVRSDGIQIHYIPLIKRRIGFDQIKQVEMRRYKPIREFGGWGIKGWSKQRIAYNVSGDEGVELTLQDGRTIMLGSQKSVALAQAIAEAMSQNG